MTTDLLLTHQIFTQHTRLRLAKTKMVFITGIATVVLLMEIGQLFQ